MQVILKISHNGIDLEKTIDKEKSLVIGRSSKADITLVDDSMSGTHCRFYLHNNHLLVFDLDSKNGTYLNGIKIEQSEFFVGDVVKIGRATITYSADKMDKASLELLNFDGATSTRLSFALRADYAKLKPEPLKSNKIAYEENKARKVDTKLTVEEIKEENPTKASLAFYIDSIILGVVGFLIGSYLYKLGIKSPEFSKAAVSGGGIFIAVLVLNFRLLKFSIGEKLAGIEEKFHKQ